MIQISEVVSLDFRISHYTVFFGSGLLSHTIFSRYQEMLLKSDAPQGVKYLRTMVECLALLGKISSAGVIIRSAKLR